jgi:CHAT domain-containing protein/tetratricopeptide repeat protein
MRTVTLEFLRHGPPHGFLLSPLARYMALCGSHQPADVTVPFEHSELLTRLRALLYKDSQVTRELQLGETAHAMSRVLAEVPGLVAELADPGLNAHPEPTHLRIIFNANELALLPFELATSASAFPGAGQSLALQPQVPMCITREVRQSSSGSIEWPRKPRILFAASSAGGEVPVQEHLLALRAVIEPWMYHYDEQNEDEWQKRISEHLTFLPHASVDDLLAACSSGTYTHIHLLAHGVPMDRDDGRRYGLALHNAGDPTEIDRVDGTRLATLLRPQLKTRIENLARPTVVTIAACDSGNVGSVIGAGASIAHALHETGIPLVVASQFPLSFAGSIVMTQVLYSGLLAGADPRLLLIDVRRQLKVRVRDTHDWASVVAYASFPVDLDRQLPLVRLSRAEFSVEAALNHADRATQASSDLLSSKTGSRRTRPGQQDQTKLLEAAKPRLAEAMDRMRAVLDTRVDDKSLIYGRLASAEKRKAEIFWRAAQQDSNRDVTLGALEQSRRWYRKAFEADRSQSWALVQAMALSVTLDGRAALNRDEFDLARLLARQDTEANARNRRAWADGMLLELLLLEHFFPAVMPPPAAPLPNVSREWPRWIAALLRDAGEDAWEVHSTRRQLGRWVEFFPVVRAEMAARKSEPVEEEWEAVKSLATQMFDKIPEPRQAS